MKIDWFVWIFYGLCAVFSVIFLFFFIAGVPITIPTPLALDGKQVILIIEGITHLILVAGIAIPPILKGIVELIKLLKGD